MFPMSIEQIKLIAKISIFGLLIIGSIWYVYHLKSEIQTQATTIATQNGTIATQNQAVIDAGLATKDLQRRVDSVVVTKNAQLVASSEKIKTVIIDRPVSTTCVDAVMNLENTAKNVAIDWNAR